MSDKKVYELAQLLRNPRDGSIGESYFDTYDTLEEAKKVAKKELGGFKWIIYEKRVAAVSSGVST